MVDVTEAKQQFSFHVKLLFLILLIFTIVDIMVVPVVNWEKREEVTVGGESYGYSPYHLWVMGALYYTMIGLVALIYWKNTGKPKGAIIIFVIGSVLMLFLVEDLLYFTLQKQPIPERWTWLYLPSEWFGNPDYIAGQVIITIALIGITTSFFLWFWHIRKKRLD